ncbi:hypothetical protein [Kineococcus aurantiacus]|uniref:Uncharacterized protein n=1 Tax=Kineococcus aurantiacus TaxID=37633 RepID=A0A7Y9DME7_9ACTN|nr:hypothetical protein [Kineococcus aurantiacus]NYD23305.1 hypothetical protein [Kineococcus aurantiacus]
MKDARVLGAVVVLALVAALLVGNWLIGVLWPGPTAETYQNLSCGSRPSARSGRARIAG